MHSSSRTSRGSVYLPVLAAAAIVTVIGLSAMWISRLQARRVSLQRAKARAELCAAAAIEFGLQRIYAVSSWRNMGTTWADDLPLDEGTFSLTVTDPSDNDLADSNEDAVVLTGIGQSGEARHAMQVTVLARRVPIDALKTCIHAGGELKVNSGKTAMILNAPASTNGNLRIDGRLDGSAEAQTASGGGVVTGTLTVPSPTKDIPEASVVQTYRDMAVTIPCPGSTMEKVVLGPQCNPWGMGSPDGVYYMDTLGNDLTIRYSRVCGTLIIRTGGKKVVLEDAGLYEAYRSDYPVLIVDGDLEIKLKSTYMLMMEMYLRTNYNPPSCPYHGHADYDIMDMYPTRIHGLIYVTGTVLFKDSPQITGTVITRDRATFDDFAELTYDPDLAENPPPGFRTIEMRLAQDSSQQYVIP